MAWVSPKVYAILSQSEEGKDIIEKLPDLTQEECQEELDAFFGDGGKGASSGNDYLKAKKDDEFDEEVYRHLDDEIRDEDEVEQAYGKKDKTDNDWEKTKMASGTLYEKGDLRIIEYKEDNDETIYRISGTEDYFNSLEEAEEYYNLFNDDNIDINKLKEARKKAIDNYNITGDDSYSNEERKISKRIDYLKAKKFDKNRENENKAPDEIRDEKYGKYVDKIRNSKSDDLKFLNQMPRSEITRFLEIIDKIFKE